MDINVLASGSSGNCYKLTDGQTSVLLDAGLPIRQIKQRLNFNLSSIDAVLITHEHMDHAKAVKDLIKLGIPTYATQGTFESLGIEDARYVLESLKDIEIGTMIIKPFDTVHDAADPVGFLIYSEAEKGGKLVYLTDTQYCKYNFADLTQIMVECNFDDENVVENVVGGYVPPSLAHRVYGSHMSIDVVKSFIKAHTTDALKEVYLIHLSDKNSDEANFKREIQIITGVPVYVC